MLSFAQDGLITADPGNIKKTHCMCRAKLSQHCANDRMRGRFRVVRNETDVHLITTRPGRICPCVLRPSAVAHRRTLTDSWISRGTWASFARPKYGEVSEIGRAHV